MAVEPTLDYNAAAGNVGKMTGDAYTLAMQVSKCDDMGQMTEMALKAQMAMTMAKTANDTVSKAMKQSGECMEACTQSM